jgi:hypothetical protein
VIPVVFIPIYGELKVWSKKGGQFGRIHLGSTCGEEAIIDRKFKFRLENCYAEADSALICINREAWFNLKNIKKSDQNLQKDMIYLEDLFRKNHSVK